MKKYFQLFGILTLVMAMAFTSCKKDDDDDNGGNSTAGYLTSGAWKISAMTVDPGINFGGGVIITDFFTMMPACAKDDFTTFNADGTMVFDEGATKCDPSDPQTTSGTWTLSNDNKTLTLKEPGEDDVVLTIDEISNSVIKGSYTMVEDFGTGPETYTLTITMTK